MFSAARLGYDQGVFSNRPSLPKLEPSSPESAYKQAPPRIRRLHELAQRAASRQHELQLQREVDPLFEGA